MTGQSKTYLYSYPFQGGWWSFELEAASMEEAEERLRALAWAKLDGELVARIPVPGGSLVRRLWRFALGRG